ncbi:MAG: hypothetical protein M5U01_21250 [Ardenticatenaceae bacterium]|nr:hypothetical protein [Ardenticatenaceae bacterium]HBY95370.1 hypothetical protein [Chloroflexota bacterium]
MPAAIVELSHCPACGERGKPVEMQTVKAMLAVSLEALRPTDYRFCRTPTCPVVYFATDGEHTLVEAELRERVHQKAPEDDDVFVCYCFRHTPGSIRAELIETGTSTAVDRVNAGIQAGQCACEIRNPQGSCCLGNVRAVVRRVTHEERVLQSVSV